MNEAAFLAFENITAVMETILYGGSMAAFFSPFFGGTASKKSQRPFEKMRLIFIIYCAVYFAGIAVPIYNWQCMTAVILLLPAIHHILEMERKTAFFLAILFFSIRGLSRLTAESLYFIVNERFVVVKKELDAILYGTAVNYTATALLQFALFFFLLYLMGRRLRSAPLLLCGKEPIYLCLIPVVGILFTSLIYAMLFHVKDGVPFQVYEQYPSFVVLVPCGAALFYAGTLAAVLSCQEMAVLREERRAHFAAELQIQAMQKQMAESEQMYLGIRQLRHDIRNHITNLKGLAQKKDAAELEQYLSRMEENLRDHTMKGDNQ